MNSKSISKTLIILCLFVTTVSQAQTNDFGDNRSGKTVRDLGDILQIVLPSVAVLTTVVVGDKEGTWQFAKSFGVNFAATYALKYIIDKPRPVGAKDGKAFPSGHTSAAFVSASFIQQRYGWKYGVPAYLLAGFVGYSRIEGVPQRHDGWDVLGGILVGVGSTYLFTTPYQKEHLELSFGRTEYNSYLVGFKYKF
ncbi:MAG: PAP2 family protein [Bacteroidetes bacterium]|nr:MAG: PAP2 family protein [Bacteroidota bacterium]